MAEDVGITIKTTGGPQSAAQAKEVSKAIGGIGHAAGGVAATGVTKLGASVDKLGSSLLPIGGMMRSLRQHAFYVGAGLAGIGALAVKSGVQFNSSMEQNRVAFSHFLGDTDKANAYLGRLYTLAAKTPFEFPQVTSAAQKFLAFGFSANEAYKTLIAVGDAAAGLGSGAEGIDRITLALGQMRAAGVVQGDELRQLQEAGINPYRYLERAGLITKGDIGQIGNMHLDSNKAIAAIVSGIEADPTKGGFGGLAAAQGKTFAGQVSTLKDYSNQTLGTITKPLFDSLEKQGLPQMTSFAQRTTQIWKTKGPFGSKVAQTETAFHHRFDPLIHEAEHAVGQMHIGRWLSDQIEEETPKALSAMGHLGAGALGAFARGWWHAGPYGKLFGALVIGAKLGVFSKLGKLAAGAFGRGLGKLAGKYGGATPVYVVNEGFGGLPGKKPGKAPGKAPGKVGWFGGAAAAFEDALGLSAGGAATSVAALAAPVAAAWYLGNHGPTKGTAHGINPLTGQPYTQGADARRNNRNAKRVGGLYQVGGAAPVVRSNRPIVLHQTTQLDGKVVAKSTHHWASDARAARKGF